MRWANVDDFCDMKVMPRMLLDHLPDNVFDALRTILEEQQKSNGISLTNVDDK